MTKKDRIIHIKDLDLIVQIQFCSVYIGIGDLGRHLYDYVWPEIAWKVCIQPFLTGLVIGGYQIVMWSGFLHLVLPY